MASLIPASTSSGRNTSSSRKTWTNSRLPRLAMRASIRRRSVVTLVGAPMTGDHPGPAGDHHLVDVAADHNLAVPVSGWHRIVGAAIAHQQLQADPTGPLLTGVIGRGRQRVERLQIPNQPFTDRLVVTAQPIAEPG